MQDSVVPQGVAPEKAIKLTVNDLVRGRAMDPETGRISPFWEFVAGGTAGGCQVVSANRLYAPLTKGSKCRVRFSRTLWKLCAYHFEC
jgi:hypothetical protein